MKEGDFVWYQEVVGVSNRSMHRVRLVEPEPRNGHDVCWLEGKAGYVLQSHCAPLEPREMSEREVIEAAKALFNGYTAEDSRQDYWKIDAVLDHRLYALFLKVEALQEARDE